MKLFRYVTLFLIVFISCSSSTTRNKNTVKIKPKKTQEKVITTPSDNTKTKIKNQRTIPPLYLTQEYPEDVAASFMKEIKDKYAEIQALEIEPVKILMENNNNHKIENEYFYNEQNELVKIVVNEIKNNSDSSEIREYYFSKNNLIFLFIKQLVENENTFENEYRYYIEDNSLINSFKKEWNSNMDIASINDIQNQPADKKEATKYYEEAYSLQYTADANVLANTLGDSYFVSFPNFAFVYKNKYLLIKPYGDETLKGDPYDVSPGSGTCDVDMDALPVYYKNLIGKDVDVYDENMNSSTYTIKSFNVIVAYTPHFSEIQRFNNEEQEESENPTEMFQNSPNKFFVASLDSEEGDSDFLWGRLSTLPEITGFRPEESEIHTGFYEEVLASDAYTSIQDDYNTYLEEEYKNEGELNSFPKDWYYYAKSEDIFYSTSKVTASFIHIESGEPCGEPSFGGELYESLIKVGEVPFTVSEIVPLSRNYYIPVQAIDLNNDDIPEFIFKDWWTGSKIIIYYFENDYHESGNYIPNYDCGC